MCREDFKKSLWFNSRHMFIEAPGEGVSTCRSKGPTGECIEDYVIAVSLQGTIKNMEVVEDFESRPLTALTFMVEGDKEFQVRREQKKPRALPGFSGGKLPGRSKVKEEEEDGEEEGQKKKMENEGMTEILAGVPRETDAAGEGESLRKLYL